MLELEDKSKSEINVAVNDASVSDLTRSSSSKGFQFWMIFVAICVSCFLSALEFVRIFCLEMHKCLPTYLLDLCCNCATYHSA